MAERNLNPKAACLKRREEEKGAEFLTAQSTSVYADHSAQPLVVRIIRDHHHHIYFPRTTYYHTRKAARDIYFVPEYALNAQFHFCLQYFF